MKKENKNLLIKCRGGFTLLEAMVAAGIFSILVTVAAGGFVRILRTEKQLEGLISANSNASLMLEQMAREIRTSLDFCDPIGGNYSVPSREDGSVPLGVTEPGGGCPPPSDFLFFKNATGTPVLYEWSQATESVIRTEWTSGEQKHLPMNADNVAVKYLKFLGKDEDSGAVGWNVTERRPRVTIVIGISSKEAGVNDIVTRLQTTVATRAAQNLNLSPPIPPP